MEENMNNLDLAVLVELVSNVRINGVCVGKCVMQKNICYTITPQNTMRTGNDDLTDKHSSGSNI